MDKNFLSQDGEDDQYSIMLPVGTKKDAKAEELAEQILNDILSAVGFTRKNYEKISKQKSPDFLESLRKIECKLWKLLKNKECGDG